MFEKRFFFIPVCSKSISRLEDVGVFEPEAIELPKGAIKGVAEGEAVGDLTVEKKFFRRIGLSQVQVISGFPKAVRQDSTTSPHLVSLISQILQKIQVHMYVVFNFHEKNQIYFLSKSFFRSSKPAFSSAGGPPNRKLEYR